jgi:hypothetical protein
MDKIQIDNWKPKVKNVLWTDSGACPHPGLVLVPVLAGFHDLGFELGQHHAECFQGGCLGRMSCIKVEFVLGCYSSLDIM